MARAKYLINNVNFENCIVKRRGSIHLQTNHGTPLKKMGLELREFPMGANGMRFRELLRRCDRWDYLISSNRYSSEVWERAYPCPYLTLESGYPRNDRLVRVGEDETARIREQLDIPAGKTVVLYAPTFRDWSRTQFVAAVPLEELCRRLGQDYLVLVRGHYFTGGNERLRQLERSGILRDVSDYPVVEDLMIASDLLLTDYSSIMFDYANLDRPIVIYAADWDQYRRARGVSFDLIGFPPGAVAMTLDQLSETLLDGHYRGDAAERARAEFRKRFCQFDDGHAAQRVVERVFMNGAAGGPAGGPGAAPAGTGPVSAVTEVTPPEAEVAPTEAATPTD
jgi:CDP-glycerol glycerophosphotransferase